MLYHLSFISFTMFTATRFNSGCADIHVDALRGSATVMFKNSNTVYRYFNVSRRAITNLTLQPNMSLGFWVNNNCFNSTRAVAV